MLKKKTVKRKPATKRKVVRRKPNAIVRVSTKKRKVKGRWGGDPLEREYVTRAESQQDRDLDRHLRGFKSEKEENDSNRLERRREEHAIKEYRKKFNR